MKKTLIVLFAILLGATGLYSQRDETVFGKSGLRFTGIWGGFSNNLSFYDDDFAYVQGGFGGLEFGKSVFVGWGGYYVYDEVEINKFTNDRFDLDYNGLILGYMPGATNAIHPKFMVLAGAGDISVRGEGWDRVIVIQPSAGIEVNVFQWFRLGLEGGYRFIGDSDFNTYSDNDFASPFAALQFKFGWSWGR